MAMLLIGGIWLMDWVSTIWWVGAAAFRRDAAYYVLFLQFSSLCLLFRYWLVISCLSSNIIFCTTLTFMLLLRVYLCLFSRLTVILLPNCLWTKLFGSHISGRNVRLPRRALPPGESLRVSARRDRQTDGHQIDALITVYRFIIYARAYLFHATKSVT